ncbi:hypothetical protein ACH5RR_006374 [Cinchona calisaya]|uniref:Uncharacterized protein n=1 Tax=Cinchona calisaya TaxID=153742 RepID=A0ABD3ANT6_9GENT
MKNRRRGNSRDEPILIENLRVSVEFHKGKILQAREVRAHEQMLQFLKENFVAIQQFVEMHKQNPLNNIPTNEFLLPREERREENTASNTLRISHQGPQVIRSVSRQRSRLIHDQLYPRLRPNVVHREETPQPSILIPDVEIMAKVELRV